jgi:dUTP pyrophosphatase
MKVRIVRIEKDLPLPRYETAGAVAFDLYTRQAATIPPGEMAMLGTNLIIGVPDGHALVIAARSSLSKKKGLAFRNGIGIIDQDYHGPEDEVRMLVWNFTDTPVSVERGERLAQGMILPIAKAEWEEVESIKEESRGGFGSTG